MRLRPCRNCGKLIPFDVPQCPECDYMQTRTLGDEGILSRIWQRTRPLVARHKKPLVGGTSVSVVLILFISLGHLATFTHIKVPETTSPEQVTPTIRVSPPSLPNGLGVVQAPNGQYVGVNDGHYQPFDVGPQRADSGLKQQAAQVLQSGNAQEALSLWNDCLMGPDTNDAEVKIYIANQQALNFTYITLILGLDFESSFPDVSSQSILQGAYLAQKEFNDQHPNTKMRLLIANIGENPAYLAPVVRQLATIAQQEPTVVGILGWQDSATTQNVLSAVHQLGIEFPNRYPKIAQIPIVSQTASSDLLSNVSPQFFRVIPANSDQAQLEVSIAENLLHATQAIVFMDPTEMYSQNLGQDFEQQFVLPDPNNNAPAKKILAEEHFTTGKTAMTSFITLLKQALNNVHDTSHIVIFFTGTADYDIEQFQKALGSYPGLSVISGDTGYNNYSNVYGRWYFVAFAFHDEWLVQMGNQAPFFPEYQKEYDPSQQHLQTPYGYDIPDATAIVSYDAAKVLAHGIDLAWPQGTTNPTPQDLENALSQIKGPEAWQGISGLIAFENNHDPHDKALIVLRIDQNGRHMVCIQGTFANKVSNTVPPCPTSTS